MRELFLFTLLSISITALSQEDFKVIDFKLLPTDYSAASHNKPPNDNNGEPAALIKIVTSEKGFTFELGSALAPIGAAQEKTGEIWLYVPNGTRRLTIKHKDFGVIRYPIEIAIKSGKTYELRLKTPITTNKDLLGTGTVKITTYPDNAVLFNYANIEYKKDFSNVAGKNQFFVKLDSYVTLDTIINIKPDQLNEFTFKLVKKQGTLSIQANPRGANVYIDNDKIGNTPISKLLLIGDYNVSIKKKGFVEQTRPVKIEENISTVIDISLVNYSTAMRPLKIGKSISFTLFAVALIGGVSAQLYANSQMTNYNNTEISSEAQTLEKNVIQFDNLAIIGFSSAGFIAVPFAIFSSKMRKMKKKYGI